MELINLEEAQMAGEAEETTARRPEESGPPSERPAAKPVYQKPIIRKYDQIEQVKPYGPSEMEAG